MGGAGGGCWRRAASTRPRVRDGRSPLAVAAHPPLVEPPAATRPPGGHLPWWVQTPALEPPNARYLGALAWLVEEQGGRRHLMVLCSCCCCCCCCPPPPRTHANGLGVGAALKTVSSRRRLLCCSPFFQLPLLDRNRETVCATGRPLNDFFLKHIKKVGVRHTLTRALSSWVVPSVQVPLGGGVTTRRSHHSKYNSVRDSSARGAARPIVYDWAENQADFAHHGGQPSPGRLHRSVAVRCGRWVFSVGGGDGGSLPAES